MSAERRPSNVRRKPPQVLGHRSRCDFRLLGRSPIRFSHDPAGEGSSFRHPRSFAGVNRPPCVLGCLQSLGAGAKRRMIVLNMGSRTALAASLTESHFTLRCRRSGHCFLAISLPTLRKPWCDHSELRQMRAQSIHQHCALSNQPLPTSVQQYSGLLFNRLGRHEAHRRPHNRLANGLRIRSVVLVPLDVSLHILRWHQPYLMAQRAQLPRPIVRRRTRLHPHQTAR
jgi:hypothetical protein